MALTADALDTTYSAPGVLMNENYPDVLDSRFKSVSRLAWDRPVQGLRYFKQLDTNRAYEKFSAVSGGGMLSKARDVDGMPLIDVVPDFDITATPEEYKAGIRIGIRLRETDQYSVIDQHMLDLNESMRETIEQYAALPYNEAFGTSTWLCGDGMYLVDDGRPFPDNGVSGTWGNLDEAADLTQGTIGTMRLNFRKHKDERGRIAPLVLKKLVGPADLEATANVHLDTRKKTGGALNDESELNKFGIKFEVWDYLTDTNAFFGFAMEPSDSKFEIYWLWGVRPNYKPYTVTDNPDVYGYRARAVFVTAARAAHALRGNAGS